MIQPDPLQFFATRVLLDNLPSYMITIKEKKGYIGDHTTAKHILRILKDYPRENKPWRNYREEKSPRFDKIHANFIMDVFTFRLMHSSDLIFPFSKCIPTFEHFYTHLRHHGNYLTVLSLDSCPCSRYFGFMDPLLDVICSHTTVLKSLTLPKCYNKKKTCCISEKGAETIINSRLTHTLQEITFVSTVVTTEKIILRILSSLNNLRILNLSNVYVIGCRQAEKLPIPFNYGSYRAISRLEHLRIYDYIDCMCHRGRTCVPHEGESCFWEDIGEQYPNLKTLQISSIWADKQWGYGWLLRLSDGLSKRKKPLEYLSVNTDYVEIVRQMNADRINTVDTLEDILYEAVRGDQDDESIKRVMIKILYVWCWLGDKTHKLCGDMLAFINFVIPNFRHISEVFVNCSYIVAEMIGKDIIKLPTSFIETFITTIMGPETEMFSLVHIIEILMGYNGGDPIISVGVFEKVLRALSVQERNQYCWRQQRRTVCECLVNIQKNDEYNQVMEKIFDFELMLHWFSEFPDLFRLVVTNMKTYSTDFLHFS